jgi:ribose-phosphate pyrophosphokinase
MQLIALPGAEDLAENLADLSGCSRTTLDYRRFPDGESYLRLDAELSGPAALVARLDRPDAKIPTLLFAAELARERGASRLGLVCPYLPYMRQDKRFAPGEALTSASFAGWLSARFDWLLTVDPHLHRYDSLDEIYRLEGRVLSAAGAIGDWIAEHIDRPAIIGPDKESAQWVEAVAARHGFPHRVLRKTRHGDRSVSVDGSSLAGLDSDCTPVLVDDIASSGHTLAQAAGAIRAAGLAAPVCAVVHGLFDRHCLATLADAGIERLVCTDSVRSEQSEIGLAPLLAPALNELAVCRNLRHA